MNLTNSCSFCLKLARQRYFNDFIIAPSSPYLTYLANKFKTLPFCAPNVSRYDGQGNYSGEYASVLLKLSNINYVFVGCSDRRNLFNETNDIIKQKVEKCLDADIIPIICIGENADIRQYKDYKEFIVTQLAESLPDSCKILNESKYIIIIYEPIWSARMACVPLEEEIVEIFDTINCFLEQSQVANNVRLVYGGSVNLNNISNILNLPNIDGVLVEKPSLDYQTLVKMLNHGIV